MIAEWLTSLRTPCDPAVRRLGYLRELIAIRARHARTGGSWDGHRESCRAFVAAQAPGGDVAVVVGAGLCIDVPVDLLRARYRRVVLFDLCFLGRPAGTEQRFFDATGAVRTWAAKPQADPRAALQDPGWPVDLPAPDLVISANVLTQLHLLPEAFLRRHHPAVDLAESCARLHLAWLQARPGVRLLIADTHEEVHATDGRVVYRVPTTARLAGPPIAHWPWSLAPAGEWDPGHALIRQVGAWRWG
jgi:hypothetical protein